MSQQKLALWACDNGTYDLIDEDGVVVQNVPAAALLNIHEIVSLLKQTTIVVEAVAHLQGKELELLPLTAIARTVLGKLK